MWIHKKQEIKFIKPIDNYKDNIVLNFLKFMINEQEEHEQKVYTQLDNQLLNKLKTMMMSKTKMFSINND